MQAAVEDSNAKNVIHLFILGIEGGAVGCLALLIMWLAASQFVQSRYALFTVFLSIPMGMINQLASQSVQLTENGEAENDDLVSLVTRHCLQVGVDERVIEHTRYCG
jgi:hypothetical protein